MSNKVCPYPGLRPFTVDESFFFKGRDLHVRQIINKLETNKILILTGASGDGKSSLVYAGLIPNARAGFFRAKFNRWVFADFRPERSPLANLAKSLASSLNLNLEETEQELGYGFSAIIDLYKSSQFYIEQDNQDVQSLSADQKRKQNMSAANLLILADQFEELFTNTENFNNGKASVEAYTCVNLLLETAKIALRDGIPIYVICTLRSDFISQCIAFRGLPEAIGFSQFFVPRLNRTELQQVIEEPALLSGGRVSKRLKEILINELHDGFDQLPILQHTLKQIWGMANNGEEELDMIHLAKLGGIDSRYLTEKDKYIFDSWKATVSPVLRNYLATPSSSNVLNAHADSLYVSAYQQFVENTEWGDKNLTEDEAKLIVKVAFQCLTKIDQGRAVRNRTTLEEITHIVDLPHIKYETVCGIINIFRLHSSTFLRPFFDENDIATQYLSSETVLDITHESLIRNWKNLQGWNEEELANVSDYREFVVQLNRWLANKRSSDFLLSIGPLSHYESWYERCKPNKYWLAKYETSISEYRERLRKTDTLAQQCKEFLEESRSFLVASERNKRRRRQLALLAAIIVIIALSAFSYIAKMEKKNAEQQRILAEKQTEVAKIQQQRAIEANKIADKERLLAQENARKALYAKAQSDSARNLAIILRKTAENATAFAYKEADNAKAAKLLAEQQRQIAVEQTQIALEQKKLAVQASDSAKMYSYLAMSQSLSFKATQKYEDKQVNLLLAMKAYDFNKRYNGYPHESYLFHALLIALKSNGLKNTIPISPDYYSSCFYDKSASKILTKHGKLILFDTNSGKVLKETNLFNSKIPINYSSFVSEFSLVASLENKKAFYVDLVTGTKIELSGHNDYIRTAVLNPSKTILITGGRDHLVNVFRLNKGNLSSSSVYRLESRITSTSLLPDNETLLVGTNDGHIYQLNISTGSKATVDKLNAASPVLALHPDGKMLAAGSNDGMIRLIDLETKKTFLDLSAGSCAVRQIIFNAKHDLMAVSFDDKTIKLFSLKNLDKSPINIRDTDQKITQLGFVGDRIYALLTDHSEQYWEITPSVYAEQIDKMLKRILTKEEWRIFVGDKILYENYASK